MPDDSLTIVDRNFLSPLVLVPLARGGAQRHWLIRAKNVTSRRVLKRLGHNDWLVEMEITRNAADQGPVAAGDLDGSGHSVQAKKGSRPTRCSPRSWTPSITPQRRSATSAGRSSSDDEIKTEVLAREEALRSKRPVTIARELWGVLLAYNLVRLEM